MVLSTQQSDDGRSHVLLGKLDNARTMANILKAIHFKESASVYASENGLKFTVEDAKCVQANAFLQGSLFSEFKMLEETSSFKVNLTVLIDCLTIFGTSATPGVMTTLKLSYDGYGSPLRLMLEEMGVTTDCSIKTQDADESLDFDFCSENVVNKIIMKSECLKEAFAELDMSSDVLEILMSPDKPYFRLSTFGNAGSTHADYSKESDMVEAFECKRTTSNRYKIALLKPSVRALAQSSKVSVRTDDRGFLSLQYLIQVDDGQVCFVEYYCSPDEECDN
ncbi:PREDICTED: cell cycle checkpoint protein RAD1-like [Priapulus caudatus]|uniref:Cell cycle checkpoint protein RAD1-like n=1 Tax=Priapulus caudatus TaxID=37621 RepID=A0ABM1F9E0_PRICU|nr:PREDICTED: cell cycle checkpoint protein RAD1-like [Priapulus caudatus]